MAARLAADNNPERLILQAPYFSLTDMLNERYPFVPGFLLNYKLATNKYLASCDMPITLFHGTDDRVVYYGSSVKLKKELGSKVELVTLQGQNHVRLTNHPDYIHTFKELTVYLP